MGSKKLMKRILATVMTAALAMTSIPFTVMADEWTPEQGLIANFDFETEGSEFTGAGAKATVNGTGAYDTGSDDSKAFSFSNSTWLNVTKEDGSALLAGLDAITISYDSNPSEPNAGWIFFASPDTTAQEWPKEHYLGVMDYATSIRVERFHNNGERPGNDLFTEGLTAGWKHVDLVITATDYTLYVNGERKSYNESNYKLSDILTESGGVLQLGKSNWIPWGGTEIGEYYTGLMDNFQIRNYALTAQQVYKLFDPTSSEEEIFEAEGFTATEALTVTVGSAKPIVVNIPSAISSDSAAISFESDDDTIASVDADGNVTGVAVGTTEITTSVTVGTTTKEATTAITVKKVANVSEPDYTYDFEDSFGDATVIKRVSSGDGYEDYTGSVVYEEGKSGKAVKLDGYGFKLNNTNIGEAYTVSMWVKPTGIIANNTPVLFLGNHDPQKWVAVSGNANAQTCKFWTRGTDAEGTFYSWAGIGTVTLPSTDWTLLTITSDGNNVKAYINGELISSGKGVEALDGENQDIYLGISYWDPAFSGLIDEVKIYGDTLTAAQVFRLFDPSAGTPGEIFNEGVMSVTPSVTCKVGTTAQINVTLPTGVDLADATITYESDNDQTASVDENGVVTGVALGTTEITTTVTVETYTKTATTAVTVREETVPIEDLIASFDFNDPDMGLVGAGALATVRGTATYVDSYGSGNGKAASISSDFWLNVTKEDGSPLLQGLDEVTISYDSLTNCDSFGTGWTVYAAPSTTGQSEPPTYFGVRDKVSEFIIERFLGARATSIDGVNMVTDWKHVDIVITEAKTELYFNGVLQSEVESEDKLSDILTESGGILYLGRANWGSGEYFTGLLDNVKIYNTAKTAEQIAAGVDVVKAEYTAGPGGKITGAASQSILRGMSASTVTATPNTGYKFVKWSDNNSTVASRTDSDLTSNLSAAAEFVELPRVRISYQATEGGYLTGTAEQDVYVGSNTTAVTAVAEEGYTFVGWDDGRTTARRTDTNVQEAKTYIANFVKNSNPVTVTYLAGAGGKISGTAVQTIEAGTDTESVTAVPNSGYKFSKWSDGVTTATRKDTNVAASKSVTAQFVKATIDPTGVKLDKNKLTIGVKETYTVVATVSPATATNKTVTYKSSNTKVATVNKNGQIKGVTKGTAKITAMTVNGKTFTCTVTVKKAPTSIKITNKATKKTITLKRGKSLQLKIKLSTGSASFNKKWTSKKAKVVSVSKTGKVKALKKGTSTITVKTFNGKKATIKIKVK